jgi:thioredoxin reductase (NADPH)
MMKRNAEVIIVGGGIAGLSAAIYLGRARRDTIVIDSGKSMAKWEPDVQNYLGFPDGIGGEELLKRARKQAKKYGVKIISDLVESASKKKSGLELFGQKGVYKCQRLLIATGIFHLPPKIDGVKPCLGHSMFFCKDCDGYRVQGKPIAIYGWRDEAVEYALGMLFYSPCVSIVTDGHRPQWSRRSTAWIKEYKIPVYRQAILRTHLAGRQVQALELEGGKKVLIEALFTTRGDLYFNNLARELGAKVSREGEILVDEHMKTSAQGVYAAGCITPANCQMIIAAGQGATAAQSINCDLFERSLESHKLRRFRAKQLRRTRTRLVVKKC